MVIVISHDHKLQTTSDFDIDLQNHQGPGSETTNYIQYCNILFKLSLMYGIKLQTTLEFQELVFKISKLNDQNYKLHLNLTH